MRNWCIVVESLLTQIHIAGSCYSYVAEVMIARHRLSQMPIKRLQYWSYISLFLYKFLPVVLQMIKVMDAKSYQGDQHPFLNYAVYVMFFLVRLFVCLFSVSRISCFLIGFSLDVWWLLLHLNKCNNKTLSMKRCMYEALTLNIK